MRTIGQIALVVDFKTACVIELQRGHCTSSDARPHSAKMTIEKRRQLDWKVRPHPPYFLDITPSDYHLVCSLEHYLWNKTFRNPDSVYSGLTDYFVSKDVHFYKKGMEILKDLWFTIPNNYGNFILDWCVILFVKIKILKKSKIIDYSAIT